MKVGPEAIKKRSKYLLYTFPRSLSLKPREITLEEGNKQLSDIITAATLDTPIKCFTIKKMRSVIKNPKKVLDYNLIIN